MVEKYWNSDKSKYAVLVSYGFGAGWASWNNPELAYDKRVVEFWLAHKDDKEWMRSVERNGTFHGGQSDANKEAEVFFKSIGYDELPYMGGFRTIELEWIPKGVSWRIKEYDGAESLEFRDDCEWIN